MNNTENILDNSNKGNYLSAEGDGNADVLEYKLEKEYVPFKDNEYFYNEINFKNALEFVDIIFDNNLDKVYFLRQYFKNFEENYGIKTSVKAKTFIK